MKDRIVTTPYFWDCECKMDYIHPQTDNFCPKCATSAEEQPDSRLDEVVGFLLRTADYI